MRHMAPLTLVLLTLVATSWANPPRVHHNLRAARAMDDEVTSDLIEAEEFIGRQRRQADGEEPNAELCDFGTGEDTNLCDWSNLNVTQLDWRSTKGENAFWLGGPQEDVTYGDNAGGYAVFETSQVLPKNPSGPLVGFESAMLVSPMRESTGPKGTCVRFWYSIGGLSPDRLRILRHPVSDEMKSVENMDDMMVGYDGSDDVVLWEARDMTMGDWKEAQVVYTFDKKHTIIFEGIPVDNNDLSRRFRGYIAVDELNFAAADTCGASCPFEGGTCGWTQDTTSDDFDWTLSRGSMNPSTGPPRDRSSFTSSALMGGYAVIDSGWPRRPGDRARLMSQEFQATNPDSPLCMRFWTHMYGNGIGTLRVIIHDMNTKEDNVIWEISGEAGNAWYQGQVPIASGVPFKIVFEAVVGSNNLGDIAIDDISVVQGACPSAPQVAAGSNGDCTFEVDECAWTNPVPLARSDEIDWVRTVAADNRAPSRDHTLGTPQGALAEDSAPDRGFYMTLPRGSVQRGGDRAWLVSGPMTGSDDPMCVSFWYFMYEPFIDPSGPSLGSLRVYKQTEDENEDLMMTPVWGLKNHQGPNWMSAQAKVQSSTDYKIVFEGSWGSSRGSGFMALDDITLFKGDCSTFPEKATKIAGDCDFQHDACQWKNTTSDTDFRWTSASISRRPANLPDHTFGGPIGYAYFDVFNQNAKPQTLSLVSPVTLATDDKTPLCISFWYASFGSGDSTILKVHRESYDTSKEEDSAAGDPVELWSVTAQDVGARPDWEFGQVESDAADDFRIKLVGQASNGGFAIDDIKIYKGGCPIRPTNAKNETSGPPKPSP